MFTNLTSRIKTTGDAGFLKAYFQKCPEQRRNIVLIIGKIYVKPQLTCRGGNVFEKATNSPLCHNNFSIHVLLFVSGKKFLFNVLPVYRLDASFQYNQTVNILKIVQQDGDCSLLAICSVHLMKSSRNNWITRKLQGLNYDDGRTAKWEHIKTLYEEENNAIVRLSKLTGTALSPKPIERQNVSLCLKSLL